MKGKLKTHTVDRYLKPIRLQIKSLIEPGATIIEYGCGNGDLLFKLADKIQSGIGLDIAKPLIAYARQRQKKAHIKHLDFKSVDIRLPLDSATRKDYSINSLLFHILTREDSKKLLKQQLNHTQTIIICGFSQPENWKQAVLLWFDQRFTKHYPNFKAFKQGGFTEGLLNSIAPLEYTTIDTFDPVIKIYIVKSNR